MQIRGCRFPTAQEAWETHHCTWNKVQRGSATLRTRGTRAQTQVATVLGRLRAGTPRGGHCFKGTESSPSTPGRKGFGLFRGLDVRHFSLPCCVLKHPLAPSFPVPVQSLQTEPRTMRPRVRVPAPLHTPREGGSLVAEKGLGAQMFGFGVLLTPVTHLPCDLGQFQSFAGLFSYF